MKNHLTIAVALLFAGSLAAFAAPDEAALKAKETAAWQAFKDKKPDDFKKVVAANMMAVYADGIADLNKEIADMQHADVKSFAIGDFKVTAIGNDTAITTYTCKVEGMIGGKNTSATYNVGTVWKQEGADWKAIFHTDAKQEAATK